MSALPALITVEQFRTLPADGDAYELHHGEIVRMTRPKAKHYELQRRLVRLLESKLAGFGQVGMEFPYRPVAEFDLRVADVAAVRQARWDAIDPEDNLRGAPDLVIEVLSPSNTKGQLRELATLCLANGAVEFWVVDAERQSVTVMRKDGVPRTWTSQESLPLEAFGGGELKVVEIF